jgi:hypothetical protein
MSFRARPSSISGAALNRNLVRNSKRGPRICVVHHFVLHRVRDDNNDNACNPA